MNRSLTHFSFNHFPLTHFFLKFLFLLPSIFFVLLLFNPTQARGFLWLLDYQPSTPYLGVFGGMNGGSEVNCRPVKTNRGYYFGVNGGKKIFPNFRFEGDLMWQRNDVNNVTYHSTSLNHSKGAIDIGSVMANGMFDFGFPFPGSPSLGGGVGYAHASGHWSGIYNRSAGVFSVEKRIKSHFKTGGFAWQIIADLNFFVLDTFKVNIEYRFFKLQDKINKNKFGVSLIKFF